MSDTILDIENLTVSFDGFKALNNLNFSMEAGELRTIIGPNGAGKTTFLDVITGKVQPTEGQVHFKGKNLKKRPEHQIARLGIGRKFQTPRVYTNLTPRENLELSCNRSKNVLSTLFGKTPAPEKRTVGGLLETIGLTPKSDIKAGLLSHGEKQWLEIGMLVAQSPDLLLVDEPVAGLTDEETELTGELLISLAESHSIIVIEHDMEFVRQIARKVTVLHQGSVLCEGTMDEVQNDPQTIEVYLGQKPTISPSQLRMLRIVASIAWSDGNLAPEETAVILSRLSQLFADDRDRQQEIAAELRDYLSQSLPVEDVVKDIDSLEQREEIAKICYEVIRSHSLVPHQPAINKWEAAAYRRLLELLELPPEVVKEIETDS